MILDLCPIEQASRSGPSKAGDRSGDGGEQIGIFYRLEQEARGPRAQSALPHTRIVVRGQYNHRYVPVSGRNPTQHLEPMHPRHGEIEDYAVRIPRGERVEKGGSRTVRSHRNTGRAKEPRNAEPNRLGIIDNGYAPYDRIHAQDRDRLDTTYLSDFGPT